MMTRDEIQRRIALERELDGMERRRERVNSLRNSRGGIGRIAEGVLLDMAEMLDELR